MDVLHRGWAYPRWLTCGATPGWRWRGAWARVTVLGVYDVRARGRAREEQKDWANCAPGVSISRPRASLGSALAAGMVQHL